MKPEKAEVPEIEYNTETIPDPMKNGARWLVGFWMNENGAWQKRAGAPWEASWGGPVTGYPDMTTEFEEVSEYLEMSPEEIWGRLGFPDDAVERYFPYFRLADSSDESNIVFVDFDDVRDPETGAMHESVVGIIANTDTYAQYSISGTGAHIFFEGSLPDGVEAIEDELPEDEAFPEAEIEVYDSARNVAMTGDHIEGTPTDINPEPELLDLLVENYHDEEPGTIHDVEHQKPAISKKEISDVEKTAYKQDIYDAIKLTDPSDIRVRSPATTERSDCISRDPTWADSTSGTRLAELEDGWVYRKGMVGLDALQLVALEEGIISDVEDYPSGEDFGEAVEKLRRRGAHIPELDQTKMSLSNAAILPETYRDNGARKISKDDLQERVADSIRQVIIEDRNACIDAIMSGGKTYGSFKVTDELDTPISYFAPRLDMYDQAAEYCKEIGIPEDEIKVLPSMKRDCPTWDGQHGDDWRERVKRQYDAGARPKAIHELNDEIPCSHDDDDEMCPYERMWDFDPDDYQVIIGHYKHAHVTHVNIGRVCVFDEDPSDAFTTRLEGSRLVQSINTFLDDTFSPPVSDFDELLQIRNDDHRVKDCVRWFNKMEQQDEFDFGSPDSREVIRRDGYEYHGYAPHAVYAILKSSPISDDSDFERGFMPSGMSGSLFFTTSDEHGDYYVEFRETPDMSYAQTVLALDGTPFVDESRNRGNKVREWSQSLGVQLEHNRILTDAERQQYIRNTLGHRYIQTSESVNPYSSGRYNNMTEDAALCAGAKEVYGDGEAPLVLTPKAVADTYEEAGWIDRGLAKQIDYPGNIRGTDRYGEERLCVQLGSTHHGDHEIRRRAAWLHTDVDVSGKGVDRDYGNNVGNGILRQMRENQTAQNVMRVGRDGDGATIVLKTVAIPDYFPIDGHGAVTGWPDGMKEVLEAWGDISPDDLKTIEVSEIADHDAISVSERQVRNALDNFCDLGYVKKGNHPEDGRKNVYVDDGLSKVSSEERAEIELPDVDWPERDSVEDADSEVRLTSVYTGDFDTSPTTPDDSPETGLQVGVGDVTGDMDGGGQAPE